MKPIVQVQNLTKEFTFSSKRGKKTLVAVDNISFAINAGEKIGFIGPNGAGKSTTIKMLTGILYPTSGAVLVTGVNPTSQRIALSYRIGCVFGQRSQLLYNLPARDSFELFGRLYDVEPKKLSTKIDELINLLGLEDFIDQPVRKLSLGQRMRAEIACSLVHDPEIIFLDEPTLGLDVLAKKNLRKMLLALNKEKGTTLFLTSHDMGDIESLCDRTMIIDKGKVIVDKSTEEFDQFYTKSKVLIVDFEKPVEFKKITGTKTLSKTPERITLEVNLGKTSMNAALQEIIREYPVADIDIDKPSLETTISNIFEGQKHE